MIAQGNPAAAAAAHRGQRQYIGSIRCAQAKLIIYKICAQVTYVYIYTNTNIQNRTHLDIPLPHQTETQYEINQKVCTRAQIKSNPNK